jgi:hypothetical protein
MIKKIKPAILFLALLLLFQGVSGQKSTSITDHLRDKFSSYIKAVPREEIYIQSDRSEYISGEDIWFSIFLLDRASFKPSESKIVYFELLNRENRPIIQKKIWMERGCGPGQITLPDTLSTGTYTLRAYTSWMKNFLPYNSFVRDIKIYNSFSNRLITEKTLLSKPNNEDAYTRYFKEGLSLKTKKEEHGILDIIVTANDNYRSANGNIFYMFIQTHGNIDLISSEKIIGNETTISVPEDQLSPGINQITLFSASGKPVCERLNFTPAKDNNIVVLHTIDSLSIRDKVSIDMDAAAELKGKPESAVFSISVAPKTNDKPMADIKDYLVFGSEFGFLPDIVIKGRPLNTVPSNVMDSLLYNVRSNWINWNAILADEVPSFIYQPENDENYLSGKLLTGTQKVPDKNKIVVLSIPGKTASFQYATTDEEGNFSFSIHADEKINDLIIQPETGTSEHFVKIESPFSDQYLKRGIAADSSESQPPYISALSVNNQVRRIYGTSTSGTPFSPDIPRPLQKRFYGKPDDEIIMKDYITLPVMTEVFFELLPGVGLKKKKSGFELTMTDPITGQLFEKSPGLFIDGVLVQDPAVAAAIDPETVEKIDVVRDKYFVGDFRFYGLVNIITKAGDFSSAPLQNYSVRLRYRAVDPTPSFISPDYSLPENKNKRTPDFRNTLYWNPSVKQDNAGHARIEFWTSDYISDYQINIQGITSDGKPFSLSKIIKVHRK